MKLTTEELEQGRAWVRAGNIDALERWIVERMIIINRDQALPTFRRVASVDPDRAVKLFDKVFEGMDPEFDRRVIYWRLAFRLTLFLIVALGCIGGIVYLIKTVF